MEKVVVVAAKRTPIGKLGGHLSQINAVELGTIVAKDVIETAKIETSLIDQVIFGNVLQAGLGQNIARQIALKSGLSQKSTAMTINEVCGSGLKAIRLGQQAIMVGDANVVLVGGTENMSQAPFLDQQQRFGQKFGNVILQDSLQDGLNDAFNQQPMGITAENIAQKYQITRAMQDEFAYQSHQKAHAAQQAGYFDTEITPITTNQQVITKDQAIREQASVASLSQLPPVFKKSGTVTAGNASGINDGASALLLMSKSLADKLEIDYLATLEAYQEVGVDPDYMGYAPVDAINTLLTNTQQTIDQIDLFEINEAFSAASVAVNQGLALPKDKVNINGGAIALGHPIGASGARIMTTLIHQLKRTHQTTGIASLCIGGGLGIAYQVAINKE